MYLEILILAHLREQARHGYDIKRQVETTLGGRARLNNNVLYPALRRFEVEGAIEAVAAEPTAGPPRRVYRLTERGRDRLLDLLEEFGPEASQDDSEFLTRVAFFHLLETRVRRRILRTRLDTLEGRIQHLAAMQVLVDADQGHDLAGEVIDFECRVAQLELAWVRDLLSRETAE